MKMLFMTDGIAMMSRGGGRGRGVVTGKTGNLESPVLIKKRFVLFMVIDAQGLDPSICPALVKVSYITDDITMAVGI